VAVIELGHPTTATAAEADLLGLAFPTIRGVGVGVVSSVFAEIYYGARRGCFGFGGCGEKAFSSAKVAVAPIGSHAKVGVPFWVEQVGVGLNSISEIAISGSG